MTRTARQHNNMNTTTTMTIRPSKILVALTCAIALLAFVGIRSEASKPAATPISTSSSASSASTTPGVLRGSSSKETKTEEDLPLHAAVKAQDVDKVRSLLKDGGTRGTSSSGSSSVNVNAEDPKGITPLIEATLTGNAEIVQLLMEAGAPAQPSPGFRHTPLRAACLTGNVPLIQLLLKAGADPNAKSEGDRTPLMGACFLRPGYADELSAPAVKAMLADQRVDPTIANSFGETALDLCRQRKYDESVKVLEDAVEAWGKKKKTEQL